MSESVDNQTSTSARGSGPAGSVELRDALVAFSDQVFEAMQRLLQAHRDLTNAVLGTANWPGARGDGQAAGSSDDQSYGEAAAADNEQEAFPAEEEPDDERLTDQGEQDEDTIDADDEYDDEPLSDEGEQDDEPLSDEEYDDGPLSDEGEQDDEPLSDEDEQDESTDDVDEAEGDAELAVSDEDDRDEGVVEDGRSTETAEAVEENKQRPRSDRDTQAGKIGEEVPERRARTTSPRRRAVTTQASVPAAPDRRTNRGRRRSA